MRQMKFAGASRGFGQQQENVKLSKTPHRQFEFAEGRKSTSTLSHDPETRIAYLTTFFKMLLLTSSGAFSLQPPTRP